jgi:uncharacterized protein YkwD
VIVPTTPSGVTDHGPDDLLCAPCDDHAQCGGLGNFCVSNAKGESICGRDCAAGPPCPVTYDCLAVPKDDGTSAAQCLPVQGTCKDRPEIPPLAPGTCGTPKETAVLAAVNAARGQRGLAPLACDPVAVYAAHAFAAELCAQRSCASMSHFDAQGRGPKERYVAAGGTFQKITEVIACGADTGAAATQGWLASAAGHREVVLGAMFTHAGPGYAACAQGPFTALIVLAK